MAKPKKSPATTTTTAPEAKRLKMLDVFTRLSEEQVNQVDQIAAKWRPPLSRSALIALAVTDIIEANRHLLTTGDAGTK